MNGKIDPQQWNSTGFPTLLQDIDNLLLPRLEHASIQLGLNNGSLLHAEVIAKDGDIKVFANFL